MPNGVPLEAYAVPIKPTLPPRPAVSDLQPRRKAAAPAGPKEIEFPEDIITGQPITQELSEAWMDLQNFVGSTWATYGINIQKPDPSSPAQGELNRRYITKLNKVQMLGATAQRAKELQEHKIAGRLRGSFGSVIPGLEGEQLLITDEFDDIIRDANKMRHNFFSTGEFEKAEKTKNEQIQFIKDRMAYSVEKGFPVEEAKFAERKSILQLENNYMDEKSRAQYSLDLKKAKTAQQGYDKISSDMIADIYKELNKNTYRVEKGIRTKQRGLFQGAKMKTGGVKTAFFDERRGMVVEPAYVISWGLLPDGSIRFDFNDETTEVMTPEKAVENYVRSVGFSGPDERKLIGMILDMLERGVKGKQIKFKEPIRGEVPPTEQEEVPTTKKKVKTW